MIKTVEWTDAGVRFIDQTKLPTEETYVTCKTYEEVADAIRTMIVRGAPAIGVTAAMGVALGVQKSRPPTRTNWARVRANLRSDRRDASYCGQPVLGRFAACGRSSPKSATSRYRPSSRRWLQKPSECTTKTLPANQAMGSTAQCCCPPAAESSPTAMPEPGHRRLWYGAGRDSRCCRVREEDPGVRRRDPALSFKAHV